MLEITKKLLVRITSKTAHSEITYVISLKMKVEGEKFWLRNLSSDVLKVFGLRPQPFKISLARLHCLNFVISLDLHFSGKLHIVYNDQIH